MTYADEFFMPDEVDTQIEHLQWESTSRNTDTEVFSYLRSFYIADVNQDRHALDRIWRRVMQGFPQSKDSKKR